ncbi:hypothetical protein B6A10_06465 [Flavobacterium sp. L1I52]|uniref:Outer membrane protein beta-barrel domain-containing protein n=1 Tax=Flavobacterium pokkalii TaxID=1940408 RepID=A0ABR7URE7_9FLAO|nr:hypothetical protein [Flavobacterium pokkalii]MBD0724818.1 hypothetical protein [Flavobacterium pokkalii]
MKKITLFMLFTLLSNICRAQVKPVDPEFYKRLLDREFTKILTGQNTNFGSYATFSTKDEIASLAGNIKIKDESSLNINLKGGVTEGLVPLVNGEDVNSNITLNLQFNLGLYKNLEKGIQSDATKRMNYEYSIDSLKIVIRKAKEELALAKKKTGLEIKQKQEKLGRLAKIDLNLIDDPKRRDIKKDSIEIQTKILTNDIAILEDKSKSLNQAEIDRQSKNLDDQLVKFNTARLEKLGLHSYNINWLSFYGRLNNKAFNLFNQTAAYEDQIKKINFNQLEFGLSYNIYNLKDNSRGTCYFAVGASYLLNDNFDDLTKKTLNDKQDISASPNSRSLIETKTVYLGEYKRNLSLLKANANLYWFPTLNQGVAFHIEPSLNTNFEEKIKFDNIVGVLVGFKNIEKDQNVINIELYYNMKDIFKKTKNEDDQFRDRSSIGLKLNFPITFKTL